MSEDILVFHCAPTLAGIKTGNLFTCPYTKKSEIIESIRALNRRLGSKGLRVIPLRYSGKKVLVYVYRPSGLARDLSRGEAQRILSEAGYTLADHDRAVIELMRRINQQGDFPHEIGLFLSYPPEDVRGFIENRGQDCKCVGAWKVYGDADEAQRTFSRYKRCTEAYCRQLRCGGKSLEQLTVAV